MLGDWWGNSIKGLMLPLRSATHTHSLQRERNVRFQIEQSISNYGYIHYLSELLFKLGYCVNPIPKKVAKVESKKSEDKRINPNVIRYNFRLTLFTFTSLFWIYTGFYQVVDGILTKRVPNWIADYITHIGLAHWIMQDGSRQPGQGIYLATNNFTYTKQKPDRLFIFI